MKELTENQNKIVDRVIREEIFKRDQMLIRLVWAHSHGFASVDSDIDLMGVHVLPTSELLGLGTPKLSVNRMETLEGVEIDFNSHELKTVAHKILLGNGNFLETVLGGGSHWESGMDRAQDRVTEFRRLAKLNISKKYYNHYRGFAWGQANRIAKSENPTVKSMLYVIRLCLTGAHLLNSGELESNIFTLEQEFGLSGVQAVVDSKTTEYTTEIEASLVEETKVLMGRCFEILDKARDDSSLPETAPAQDEMEQFVIELRKTKF